jgi:hypothetical protein
MTPQGTMKSRRSIRGQRLLSFLAIGALVLTVAACNNPTATGGPMWAGSASTAKWSIVGNPGFSASNVNYTSMAVDPTSGAPYVAFEDGAFGAKTTVMKYANGAWTYVGTPGFSATSAQNVQMAFDSAGVPYVAYWDANFPNNVNVMVYTPATGWQLLGGAMVYGPATIWEVVFAINKNNVPYVAFRDNTSTVRVMNYTGAWSPVGTPVSSNASNISLAFDGMGQPWVSFADGFAGNNATVMSFNGVWTLVGPVIGSASAGAVGWTSLAIDSRNTTPTPYLAVMDTGYASRTTVKKFLSGTSTWVNVGNPGFSAAQPYSGSLVLSAGGIPFVAYQDGPTPPPPGTGGATVMMYSGTTWSPVGTPQFSPTYVQSTSLALDPLGAPYIAFMDGLGQKTTVMAYK